MKVGIFSPYLDTLGGGEKYIFEIAQSLSSDHDVNIFWDKTEILAKGSERFGLDLSKVKLTPNIFNSGILKKILETKSYDLIIYLSDGSIPFLFAKKNFLILQFPVNWINARSPISRLKLTKINGIICYSEFVKKHLKTTFGLNINVLSPAVDNMSLANLKKENSILSVGRFTQRMNMKKQEIMIEAFKNIYKSNKDWRFTIVGGVLDEDMSFVSSLREKSKGFPIEINTNVSLQRLKEFYQKAKIYWHAAGFGEDLENHPELAEHFGISTLEAMSAGTVPVVINAGGQKEIITDGVNGFLWNSLNELEVKTQLLIKDTKLLNKLSDKAVRRSYDFGTEKFCAELRTITNT